jgi:NhaA family Na+:H+ antiporter
VPSRVKLILLALAIVDDIGAIIVIAFFYTDSISIGWLVAALSLVVVMGIAHRASVMYAPILVAGGLAVWLAVYESGVHATIAGVALGLLTPARPRLSETEADEVVNTLENRRDLDASEVRATAAAIKASVSDCDRAIDALHPWTSYVIVPLFALANAGIVLSSEALSSPSAVFVGVFFGLVVGKLVGVVGFSWLAVRVGMARLPDGVSWPHMVGIAAVAGVGFTVSLFIAGLAFTGAMLDQAKLAILAASLIAALLGASLLAHASRGEQSNSFSAGTVDLDDAQEYQAYPPVSSSQSGR